jgi:hypothetical protein
VWTKLGDEFPDECEAAGLSDAAVRTHVEGLIWSNRVGLEGQIPKKHLRRFAFTEYGDVAVAELIDAGFWADSGAVYLIRHHLGEQIEPAVVEVRKTADRLRKRRERYVKALAALGVDVPKQAKGELTEDYVSALRVLLDTYRSSRRMSADMSADSPRTCPQDVARDPGLVGSGQASELQEQQLRKEQLRIVGGRA